MANLLSNAKTRTFAIENVIVALSSLFHSFYQTYIKQICLNHNDIPLDGGEELSNGCFIKLIHLNKHVAIGLSSDKKHVYKISAGNSAYMILVGLIHGVKVDVIF